MSKSIENQAQNYATVVGTLLDASVKEMETKSDKRPFRAGAEHPLL